MNEFFLLIFSGKVKQIKARKFMIRRLLLIFEIYFAEREGFEPPVPCSTAVFKTAAIDHSATSPWHALFLKRCKDKAFPETTKDLF